MTIKLVIKRNDIINATALGFIVSVALFIFCIFALNAAEIRMRNGYEDYLQWFGLYYYLGIATEIVVIISCLLLLASAMWSDGGNQ